MVATAGELIAPQSLLVSEWQAPPPPVWMAPAVAGVGLSLAVPTVRTSSAVSVIVGSVVAWADLEAALGPVVRLMVGLGDRHQMGRLDAAYGPALLVVHVLLALDRSVEVNGDHDPYRKHAGAIDLDGRAFLRRIERGDQAALLVAPGTTQDPCSSGRRDGDSGSIALTPFSAPGAQAQGRAAGTACELPRKRLQRIQYGTESTAESLVGIDPAQF
jgi:hypothetical protein